MPLVKSRVAVSFKDVGAIGPSASAVSSSDQNDLSPASAAPEPLPTTNTVAFSPAGFLGIGEGRSVRVVDDDRAGTGRLDAKADRVGREPAEERHVDQPGSPGRQGGDPALHLSGEQSGDPISRPQPCACEHPRRLGRLPVELLVRPSVGRSVFVSYGQRQPARVGGVARAHLVGGVEVVAEGISVQAGLDLPPMPGRCRRCGQVGRHHRLTFAVFDVVSTRKVMAHAAATYAASAHWPSVAEDSATAMNGAGALKTTPPNW